MEQIFLWDIQRTWIIQKQGAMVKLCVSIVAGVERFAPCKDDLCPFHNHYVVLEANVQFSLFVLFLVQAIWRKFKQGSGNIAISFRWCPKYTLNMFLFQLCFPCLSFHVHLFICFYFIFCLMFCSFGEISIIHLCLQWILVFVCKPREGICSFNR